MFPKYDSCKQLLGEEIMIRLSLGLAVTATLALATPILAHAGTLHGFVNKSEINGVVRSYYFSKLYGADNKLNQDAYSLGGILNVRTAPFLGGFGVGVSFFTANALGTHGDTPNDVDTTLMGIAPSINALGQAYIQYALSQRLMLRVGNQIINTPWMGPRDSRMLPQTFQGIYAALTPITGLRLEGMRVFRWKSRTSSDYSKDNLYYPTGYNGDPMYGVKAVLPKTAAQFQGTLAFGANYKAMDINLSAWYYNFYGFANMFYTAAAYTLKTPGGFSPFIAAQYMREWENDSFFQKYHANLFGQTGSVNATLWGTKLGMKFPGGQIFAAYNALSPHAGAFGGGAIVSPYGNYTAMYASFMTDNLLAFGPGHVWRLGAAYTVWHKQIRFISGYSHFDTYYSGKTNGVYFDLTYAPEALKGLSIRDRVAINNGLASYYGHSYIYNRLMLQYAF